MTAFTYGLDPTVDWERAYVRSYGPDVDTDTAHITVRVPPPTKHITISVVPPGTLEEHPTTETP